MDTAHLKMFPYRGNVNKIEETEFLCFLPHENALIDYNQ